MTSGKPRQDCLPAGTIAKAARGELSTFERGRVADHLAHCADCSEDLKLIEPLRAWAERSAVALGHPPTASATQAPWRWAAAAAVMIASVVTMWNVALQRENRELTARVTTAAAASSRPAPVAAAPALIANSLIIDVHSDALRSGASTPVSVPADATLVTLILNSDLRAADRPYRLEIVTAAGTSIWSTDTARLGDYHTFTVSLSPRELGAGDYRLDISQTQDGRTQRLERYLLRIQPPAR